MSFFRRKSQPVAAAPAAPAKSAVAEATPGSVLTGDYTVDGSHSLYCAVIVKRVTASTREKTSINELLRD